MLRKFFIKIWKHLKNKQSKTEQESIDFEKYNSPNAFEYIDWLMKEINKTESRKKQ